MCRTVVALSQPLMRSLNWFFWWKNLLIKRSWNLTLGLQTMSACFWSHITAANVETGLNTATGAEWIFYSLTLWSHSIRWQKKHIWTFFPCLTVEPREIPKGWTTTEKKCVRVRKRRSKRMSESDTEREALLNHSERLWEHPCVCVRVFSSWPGGSAGAQHITSTQTHIESPPVPHRFEWITETFSPPTWCHKYTWLQLFQWKCSLL